VCGEALADTLQAFTRRPVAPADIRHAFAVSSFAFAAHDPIIKIRAFVGWIPGRPGSIGSVSKRR
jgi:hypothetical protein